METAQLKELVLQSLAHEHGGLRVYKTALKCAADERLKEEWGKYFEQTQRHVTILEQVCSSMEIDAEEQTPGTQVVTALAAALVRAMQDSLASGNRDAAQLVACECVVLAETKEHLDWQLIQACGKALKGEIGEALRDAAAAVRNAYLTLERTELAAPVAGFVARRNVQLGQRVSPGAALMAVVPLDQVWVDANFKEPQLAHMRIGQHVRLSADLYGGHVSYHGTVAGFGAGTGAAFSLLPAQNATGNWIKIVQRVPVRIALDPREIAAHPLQIGLSMKADVEVRGAADGARLPQIAGNQTAWTTAVTGESDAQADARVQAIIAANESAPAAAPSAHALPAAEARPAGHLVARVSLPGTARHLH